MPGDRESSPSPHFFTNLSSPPQQWTRNGPSKFAGSASTSYLLISPQPQQDPAPPLTSPPPLRPRNNARSYDMRMLCHSHHYLEEGCCCDTRIPLDPEHQQDDNGDPEHPSRRIDRTGSTTTSSIARSCPPHDTPSAPLPLLLLLPDDLVDSQDDSGSTPPLLPRLAMRSSRRRGQWE